MIELTMERVKELLAEAVAERGEDYVYALPNGTVVTKDNLDPCRYVHYENSQGPLPEPVAGCIAGLVLHKAGLPLDVIEQYEGQYAGAAVRYLTKSGHARVERGVDDLLTAVQRRQDAAQPWGLAVRHALADLFPAG